MALGAHERGGGVSEAGNSGILDLPDFCGLKCWVSDVGNVCFEQYDHVNDEKMLITIPLRDWPQVISFLKEQEAAWKEFKASDGTP